MAAGFGKGRCYGQMQPAWQATRLLYTRQGVHNRVALVARRSTCRRGYLGASFGKQFQTLEMENS